MKDASKLMPIFRQSVQNAPVVEPPSTLVKPAFAGLKSGFLQVKEKDRLSMKQEESAVNNSFLSSTITTSSYKTGVSSSSIDGHSSSLAASSLPSLRAPAIAGEDTSSFNLNAFSFLYLNVLRYLPKFYEAFMEYNNNAKNPYCSWQSFLSWRFIDKAFIGNYVKQSIEEMPVAFLRFSKQTKDAFLPDLMAARLLEMLNIVDFYDLNQYQKIAKSLIVKFLNTYKKDYPLFKVVELCDLVLAKIVTTTRELASSRQRKLDNLEKLKSVVMVEIFCRFALQKGEQFNETHLTFMEIIPFLRRPLNLSLLDEYIYVDRCTKKSLRAKEILADHPFLGVFINAKGVYGDIIKANLHQYGATEEEKLACMLAKFANLPRGGGETYYDSKEGKKIANSLDKEIMRSLLQEFKDLAWSYESYEHAISHNRFFLEHFVAFLEFKVDASNTSLSYISFVNEIFLSAAAAAIANYLFVLEDEEIANTERSAQQMREFEDPKISPAKGKETSFKDSALWVIFPALLRILHFYEFKLLSLYAKMDIAQADEKYLAEIVECMSFYPLLDYVGKVMGQSIGSLEFSQRVQDDIEILEKARASRFFSRQKQKLVQKKIWDIKLALNGRTEAESLSPQSATKKAKQEWSKFEELLISLARAEYQERAEKERQIVYMRQKQQEAKRRSLETSLKQTKGEQPPKDSAQKKHGVQQSTTDKPAKQKNKPIKESIPFNKHTQSLQAGIKKMVIENMLPATLKENLKKMLSLLDEDFFKTHKVEKNFSGICYNVEIVLKYIVDCLEKNFLKKLKKYHDYLHELTTYGSLETIKIKEASKYFTEHTPEIVEILPEMLYFSDRAKYMLSFVYELALEHVPADAQDVESYLEDNLGLKRVLMLYDDSVEPLNHLLTEYQRIFIDEDLLNRCLTKLNRLVADLGEKKALLDARYEEIKRQQNLGFRPRGLPRHPLRPTLQEARITMQQDLTEAQACQEVINTSLEQLQKERILPWPTNLSLAAVATEDSSGSGLEVMTHDPYNYETKLKDLAQVYADLDQTSLEIKRYKISLGSIKRQFQFICGEDQLTTEDLPFWLAHTANNS